MNKLILYIMASSSYVLFVIGLCVCVTLLNPISCYGHYLIVFGDSLFDVGNNQYFTPPDNKPPAYYSPYGMTINKPTGRYCDGFVVPDFICLFLGVSAPPALEKGANFSHGASFASGGAGVLNNSGNGAMNFRDQFGNFSKMVADNVWKDEALLDAIYMFSIGGNDYFQFIDSHINVTVDETEQEQLVQEVLGNYTEVLEGIYNLGARKFVFQNVAPLGCLPTWRYKYNMTNDTCPSFPLKLADLHNAQLKIAVANLARRLPGFNYTIFDYNKTLMKRINMLEKCYGCQVSASACCGYGPFNGTNDCGSKTVLSYNLCNFPSTKVFFDSGHHSQHTNEQLAWTFWSGDRDEIAPYNMMELLEIKTKGGKAHKLSDQIADE